MIQELTVSLTKAQVKRSPDIDTRKPVSRQREAGYARYYGYPYYWGGAGVWGMGAYPGNLTAADTINETVRTATAHPSRTADDCHLWSSNEVICYQVHATDGEIGHIDDLLVDDDTWAIRYLIVGMHRWRSSRQVLVAPRWINDVSWSAATVSVDWTRFAIKGAPAYDSQAQVDRQREQALHDHYDRPGYWAVHTRSRQAPRSVHGVVHAGRRR